MADRHAAHTPCLRSVDALADLVRREITITIKRTEERREERGTNRSSRSIDEGLKQLSSPRIGVFGEHFRVDVIVIREEMTRLKDGFDPDGEFGGRCAVFKVGRFLFDQGLDQALVELRRRGEFPLKVLGEEELIETSDKTVGREEELFHGLVDHRFFRDKDDRRKRRAHGLGIFRKGRVID